MSDTMTQEKEGIIRRGSIGKGAGGQRLPFARSTEAGGFLYVSGQVPMEDGEIVGTGIVEQANKTIENLKAILDEAGYGMEHVIKVGIWLDDPRDFWSFNKVFEQHFGEFPPARSTVQSSMVVDCKIEMDLVAYKAP